MTGATLHYVHDPLCGWCYAAGPMVEAVARAGVSIVLHGGGLWDPATQLAPDKRAHIRGSDARIADLAGVRFGTAYLDGLLQDPETVFWSRPPTAALLAGERIELGAGLRMMRAVQQAHYVEGRRVVETATLLALAAAVGLPADAFAQALADAPVDAHVSATRRLMRQAGLSGFPSFLLERGGEAVRVAHEPFYGRPDAFLELVRTVGAASAA